MVAYRDKEKTDDPEDDGGGEYDSECETRSDVDDEDEDAMVDGIAAAKDDPDVCKKLKVGASFLCKDRVARQGHSFAALLMSMDEMHLAVNTVDGSIVDAIKQLKLCFLQFNANHEDRLTDFIVMQICETVLACSYQCVTKMVGERMVAIPSQKVLDAILPHELDPRAVNFMRDIPDDGIFNIFTWATLPTRMRHLAAEEQAAMATLATEGQDVSNEPFLSPRLHPEPPKGGFVTAYLAMEVAGPKYGGWRDAVPVSPREVTLDEVVESLRAALETNDPVAMRAALEAIQGSNYSHYVSASPEEVADGAKPLLESLFRRLPSNHVISMERTTFQALLDVHGDWLETVIDIESKIDAVPGDDKSLSLYRGREHGHRIKVTASEFVAYAEETRTAQRFESVKANMINTELMHLSGNYDDPSHVEKRRAISQTFLMDLDADDDNDEFDCNNWEDDSNDADDSAGDTECRGARNRAFPKGYFLGRKKL